MKIPFTKMHGLGNDFIIINNLSRNIHLTQAHIQKLSDRHTGIGFDQLLMVEPAPERSAYDFSYRIFNADGAEVEQCGNGARCFAKYIYDKGLSAKVPLVINTKAGKLVIERKGDHCMQVAMGEPQMRPAFTLMIEGVLRTVYEVDMGNPHAVVLVNAVETVPIAEWSSQVVEHTRFPNGVNVGWMQIIDQSHINLRVYERGVGETHACGSGACAAVAVGRSLELLSEKTQVRLPGGSLKVSWQGAGHTVWLMGPAVEVFEGTVWLEEK